MQNLNNSYTPRYRLPVLAHGLTLEMRSSALPDWIRRRARKTTHSALEHPQPTHASLFLVLPRRRICKRSRYTLHIPPSFSRARVRGILSLTALGLHRLLSHTIHTHVLNPALLPPALQAIRRAIFPDDALGPARVPPSDDEVVAIRRECARVIVEVVPPYVRSKYFATSDVAIMRGDVEDSLDLFADSFINKHLVVEIVELIFLRLFPEIGEQ